MKQQSLLSVEERDAVFRTLPEEQRAFLEERMKRGRRTQFARQMAEQKGAVIPESASYEDIESLLSDWIYVGYIDAGHVSEAYPCECGRSLRYQHTVQNKATGEVKRFGIDHLEMHTGIDARTVQAILKGFNVIDYELSEILRKVTEGWKWQDVVRDIPAGLELTADIAEHIELGLPLLERQVAKLKALIREHLDATPRQKQSAAVPRGAGAARTFDAEGASGVRPDGSVLLKKPEPARQEPKPVAGLQQLDLFADSGDQLTFDLFAEPPAAKEPEARSGAAAEPNAMTFDFSAMYGAPAGSAKSGDKLTERQREAVIRYLQEGVQSARIICELLIRNEGAPDGRYLTQKPVIYSAVCRLIDGQVASGAYKLASKDGNDRVYERIG
ncbi:DUF3895 domain-containing protein [Paenibacillus sp. MBLB4367]|uniref:DUF3895 domain-containing protein n=1 Tax=Paenibacillus sp. MBLB4367 TaxID=3384767 RepID=UPI0039084175